MVGPTIEFDTVLELCQDQHRRIVLAVLAHEKRSLTLNDLTKTILKHNHHAPIMEIPEAEATQIRISLYHMYIPALAELSLVEYDRERRLVEPTSRLEQLEPQLSAIISADPGLEPPVTL
ncbi:DUF7344 domain-containing protein [Halosolutus halophilus]|uniref:DUF7344 domain-containing protein n=1 Tax=Halosolutus halophilus TaxID=1552990 RepID=UPI002234F06A|nr:hypothetical protein [Halosolutus halophilus]